jgi:hypothetical protein
MGKNVRLAVFFGRSYRFFGASQVALMVDTLVIIPQATNNTMKNTSVVEDNHIAILPFVSQYIFGVDCRALDLIKKFADLVQITHWFAIDDEILNSTWMNLKVDLASDRVLPKHGVDLNGLFVDWRELFLGELSSFRNNA